MVWVPLAELLSEEREGVAVRGIGGSHVARVDGGCLQGITVGCCGLVESGVLAARGGSVKR